MAVPKSTMKLFMCCFLILLSTMVVPAPVRAQREDVLSFITDALEKTRTTEKAKPANITGYRKPPSKPVTEDSEDMSEAKSAESFAMNGRTEPGVSDKNGGESRDAAKDLDSDEIMIPTVVDKDQALSMMTTGADIKLMDTSRRLVQDHGSREQSGPKGPHHASSERTEFHSEEEMTVPTHEVERLQGKQVIYLRADKVTGSTRQVASVQRKAGRVDVLNGMLTQDESRELLDRDSLEDNNGRPVLVGNSRDRDYDETREYISSEIYPQAPTDHMPSSLSVPAKSRAS